MQEDRPGNLLLDGGVRCGDIDAAFAVADAVAEIAVETPFVEHAYIEPEAGFARRVADRLEVHVTTQTPHMDLIEVAEILDLHPSQVRIVPTAVGGGFGFGGGDASQARASHSALGACSSC